MAFPSFNINFNKLRHLFKTGIIKLFSDNTRNHYQDNRVININIYPDVLKPLEREKLIDEIKYAINEGNQTLLRENAQKRIEDFRKEEQEKDSIQITNFFRGKVPEKDLTIIRGALYIRQCFKRGENIGDLKLDVMLKHGERGKNIVNLCTAGYFEEYIIPFYDVVLKQKGNEEEALKAFHCYFDRVANELPFTIFVRQDRTPEYVIEEVKRKVEYGTKFVNIHGIGEHNVKTVYEAIAQLGELPNFESSVEQESKIIFARLNSKEA